MLRESNFVSKIFARHLLTRHENEAVVKAEQTIQASPSSMLRGSLLLGVLIRQKRYKKHFVSFAYIVDSLYFKF